VAANSTPEAFAGSAAAEALKLDLFGTNLTLGSTSAEADTTPEAKATGSGVALITSTTSTANATTDNPTSTPAKQCGLNLPLTGLLNLALACSQSAGSVTNSAPTASSAANIADIDVGVLNTVLQVLQPILNALTPMANQILGNVLTTVTGVLGPLGTTVTNLLGNLGISTSQPVSSLITALEKATTLLSVHVGDSTAAVTTSSDTVVATSMAQGATISVLPGLTVGGGPLLSITVGQASTTSTYARGTGVSTGSFDPAILTVNLLGTTIHVGLGSPITLFAGTPLESTISLGAGTTTHGPNGSITETADGVSLDLLKGLNGGISLALADATSTVGGTPAVLAPQIVTTTTAAPVTTTTVAPHLLATTGADEAPLLPIGFVLLLLGYLTRRKWLTRRSPSAR
jgi:hypothetical protein